MKSSRKWSKPKPTTYRLCCRLTQEDNGFSIVCENLPGCASQGSSREKAIENIKEAFLGLIESYEADGKTVPWEPVSPVGLLCITVSKGE